MLKLRTTIIALFCMVSINSHGQLMEMGFGFGTANYSGDLSKNYQLIDSKPAFEGHFRTNLSNVVSVKFASHVGWLYGSDLEKPVDDLARIRNHTFNRLMADASMTLEYHFLNFRSGRYRKTGTPYFMGGIGANGMLGYSRYTRTHFTIPFGIGYKYNYNRRINLELEFGARKSFTDDYDEVTMYLPNISTSASQFGNRYNDDWYYFFMFNISYIFYSIECPFGY